MSYKFIKSVLGAGIAFAFVFVVIAGPVAAAGSAQKKAERKNPVVVAVKKGADAVYDHVIEPVVDLFRDAWLALFSRRQNRVVAATRRPVAKVTPKSPPTSGTAPGLTPSAAGGAASGVNEGGVASEW